MRPKKHTGVSKLERSQKESANQVRRDVYRWLSRFPAFNTIDQIRPLKKGIITDILLEAEKDKLPFSKTKLKQTVSMFINRLEYLVCLKIGRDERIDLYGNPAGLVTEAERMSAALTLKKRVDKMTRETLNEEKAKEKKEKKVKDAKIQASYPYRPPVKPETVTTSKAPQIVVKRKVAPERIARIREKLGLPSE